MLTHAQPKQDRSTASNPLPDLWNADYTARFLHCSLGTLLKLAGREIPAVKIGRGWVFDPVKVRAWLDAKMEGQK
jgi:hypothetical protein